ncbi:hypothetical protein HNQ51_000176 [Inhella inkyongensis]|uniref:Uncharacterized protein n=1 Tax=Inhella inkyongensis TaxID=392593 RepID=A0A840RZA1_9BURK|nr:hypothetical protein [Inhella inkyongensis]MBB5202883.1 hypothetical protein [Inhella inkyongensis]
MAALFLSASIPVRGRGHYHETASPFLIQCAVRELVIATIRTHRIVWGGHPSITPMIWSICEDLGVAYSNSVVLYQSRFFEDRFPEENQRFDNVIFTDAVPNDREASLLKMREAMLGRDDLTAAVFIGGMDGVQTEYQLFRQFHPAAPVLPVAAPGGAAFDLAQRLGDTVALHLQDVNFAGIFHSAVSGWRDAGGASQSFPRPTVP